MTLLKWVWGVCVWGGAACGLYFSLKSEWMRDSLNVRFHQQAAWWQAGLWLVDFYTEKSLIIPSWKVSDNASNQTWNGVRAQACFCTFLTIIINPGHTCKHMFRKERKWCEGADISKSKTTSRLLTNHCGETRWLNINKSCEESVLSERAKTHESGRHTVMSLEHLL